ncbi:4-galactosyl-N-acetylglucosaminide 3-alpha-L-fucosyltransferase 9-like [Pangasianodon hypophthalmus]|uniref:4-galactosyl-N-acetylglucosaminide 3-alpha-L-fucosyltransferase 9-like n=1 Tax=Pangasianodon hypophthalmus TaxID=310915 RepID=UPI002307EC0C|nr:4-galactosyl-N-acetylglucosaminide 3-alpha-L-fucosyltransferase 9-like [Pangasianodon hypophthalmus]
MKSECPVGRRPILLVLVTLLCFEGLFHILYTPSGSSQSCSDETSNHNVARDEEVEVEVEEEARRPADWRRKQDHDTVVLIWRWPFGHRVKPGSCSEMFDIAGCRLTDDWSEYDKVDGVMFHHRDIHSNISELLRMRRPPLQKWVWMNMESPVNSQRQARLDGVFNLTASYRRDSDVWVPYGRIVEASEEDETFQIPPKDKLVCWIVNNWDTHFKRVRYFYELRKHVPIHTYGGAFERKLSLEEYYKIMSSCKFYLSFENSIHKDYFTEKLFNPLKVGTVPVVLGPPRENYEDFIPADSFIHVDDFKSPQELAKHLIFLDQNQKLYEQFFTWRQHFTAKGSYFGLEHACRICDHIKRNKGYRVFNNLSKWYWG